MKTKYTNEESARGQTATKNAPIVEEPTQQTEPQIQETQTPYNTIQQLQTNPNSQISYQNIMALQNTVGNQAVGQLMANKNPIQRKPDVIQRFGIGKMFASMFGAMSGARKKINKVKKGVGEKFSKVKKGVGEKFNKVKEKVGAEFNTAKEGYEKYKDEKKADKIQSFKEKSKEKISSGMGKLEQIKNEKWTKILKPIEPLKERILEKQDQAADLPEKIEVTEDEIWITENSKRNKVAQHGGEHEKGSEAPEEEAMDILDTANKKLDNRITTINTLAEKDFLLIKRKVNATQRKLQKSVGGDRGKGSKRRKKGGETGAMKKKMAQSVKELNRKMEAAKNRLSSIIDQIEAMLDKADQVIEETEDKVKLYKSLGGDEENEDEDNDNEDNDNEDNDNEDNDNEDNDNED